MQSGASTVISHRRERTPGCNANTASICAFASCPVADVGTFSSKICRNSGLRASPHTARSRRVVSTRVIEDLTTPSAGEVPASHRASGSVASGDFPPRPLSLLQHWHSHSDPQLAPSLKQAHVRLVQDPVCLSATSCWPLAPERHLQALRAKAPGTVDAAAAAVRRLLADPWLVDRPAARPVVPCGTKFRLPPLLRAAAGTALDLSPAITDCVTAVSAAWHARHVQLTSGSLIIPEKAI